ncbi:glycoside hydrolase family 47 protein [Balneola sp. MJW-20]|uniref:glycoside hydrolase family 47 protein n=1 Tax=Gracilimonas aurantiaca TaxID=3234185 RepID=UPI0034650C45
MIRKLSLFILSTLFITAACTKEVPVSINKQQMAESVKTEFLHAWNGYKTYAWGYDELKPVSDTARNWYDVSLLMTPVDAYDTMILMGLNDEAEEAKDLILSELHFDHDMSVQNFEIVIRMLGGLLSAYQMDGDERFLELAKDLGDRLLPVFDSPTGLPYVNVNLQTGETSGIINNPAEIGTLILEFGTLSGLTGDPVYFEKADRAMKGIYERRSDIGLVGETINVETGEWVNTSSHISGRIDSYYEYLLKASELFGLEDYRMMYDESITAVNEYLLDETETGTWYGRADMYSGERTATTYGALDAFMPGMLVFGGELEIAKKVQEANYSMWTMEGIEPEGIDYSSMEITSPYYLLRPENIESAFYLYRATGDDRYLKMGKTMFESIVEYCKTESGFAELADVRTKEKNDGMQSFFLAETLKYSYLLFADESTLDLDTHVFNTEAHPLTNTWDQ